MTDAHEIMVVYLTASSREEADKIAGELVARKLAACVNILGEISSVYDWQGNIEHGREIALIAKTTSAKFPELERAVKTLHSYECPCVVAWPLSDGHAPFLEWVKNSVQ
ncbi:MAG TPA: divalent-cation tolerance protein CutA [Kiritimatiellia bacterium]|nr:divalent-cation tolerance protein CutA [Kiritimatiellia bacterium]